MSENTNDKPDASVIEVEAEPVPEPESVESKRSDDADMPKQPDSSSGGGFVWMLAVLIVIAGGGYAAWPYVGDKAEPYIKEARAVLGLQARPTQPSLPGTVSNVQRPAPVVAPVTKEEPPAPMAAPMAAVASAPVATPVPESVPAPEPVPAPLAQEPAQAPTLPIASASVGDLQSMSTRLDVLEAQLNAAMSSRLDGGEARTALDATGHLARTLEELRAQIATLNTRLNVMEQTPRGLVDPSASAQALVLSVTQLQSRAGGDAPFAAELDALERIGGVDPVIAAAVSQLRPYAQTGAPTQAVLATHFKFMAAEVMRVHGRSEQSGWWGEVSNKVSSLVTVRRTDPARIDDDVERALAIAERALGQNDLKTAVGALSALQGGVGEASAAWRNTAQARVIVQDAIAILHNHALGALSATGGA